MSRRGNCWDNAVAESFFSSLKKERIKKKIYGNREIAHADISEYIESFYNQTRRHSYLGGVSPEHFEAAGANSRRSSLRLYMTAVTNGGCRTVTTLPLPPDYKTYAYSGWDFVNRRACHVSSNETENGYSAS
jgi:Integrase core domain